MNPIVWMHIIAALKRGYFCWPELHWYFHDHSRGGWIEWLCN